MRLWFLASKGVLQEQKDYLFVTNPITKELVSIPNSHEVCGAQGMQKPEYSETGATLSGCRFPELWMYNQGEARIYPYQYRSLWLCRWNNSSAFKNYHRFNSQPAPAPQGQSFNPSHNTARYTGGNDYQGRPPAKCQICLKVGHYASKCYFRYAASRNSNAGNTMTGATQSFAVPISSTQEAPQEPTQPIQEAPHELSTSADPVGNIEPMPSTDASANVQDDNSQDSTEQSNTIPMQSMTHGHTMTTRLEDGTRRAKAKGFGSIQFSHSKLASEINLYHDAVEMVEDEILEETKYSLFG
ncbi:hypothetical protein IFM89_006570 [Coptis chinensis]|uniref:Uncharacterized protein n=1 Tax=Coptis chinensis TaxID=261450 RepID=A0A835IMN9_9MAGN|nr:hypothetical protein IFM89_006570 [Coptis chinensis]